MSYKGCDDCFESICKKSPSLSLTWLDLCENGSDEFLRIENIKSKEKVFALELLGFVVTHETDEGIFFRLNGIQEGFVCKNPFEHAHIIK